MNKKGAEMMTIIMWLVIIAIVLVILVVGFTTGWANLWGKIVNFGGGKVNVQTVVQACNVACTGGNTYDYCTLKRNVVFSDSSLSGKKTCKEIEAIPSAGLGACDDIVCG